LYCIVVAVKHDGLIGGYSMYMYIELACIMRVFVKFACIMRQWLYVSVKHDGLISGYSFSQSTLEQVTVLLTLYLKKVKDNI